MELFIPICGSGTRLVNEKNVPKPLLPLKGKSLVEHALEGFRPFNSIDHVVVGIPENTSWKEVLAKKIEPIFKCDIQIVEIANTNSQLETIHQMLKNRSDEFQIVVHNCDTVVEFSEPNISFDADAIYYFFESFERDLSKLSMDSSGGIIGIQERSEHKMLYSSSGTYAFRNSRSLYENIDKAWFDSGLREFSFSDFCNARRQLLSFKAQKLHRCYPLGTYDQIRRNISSIKI